MDFSFFFFFILIFIPRFNPRHESSILFRILLATAIGGIIVVELLEQLNCMF